MADRDVGSSKRDAPAAKPPTITDAGADYARPDQVADLQSKAGNDAVERSGSGSG